MDLRAHLRGPFREQDGQIAVELPGARAIFTTRSWGDVRETQQQIGERLGVKLVRPKQVHGSAVIAAAADVADGSGSLETEADAVITASRGIAPTVITADCLPIV